MRKIIWAIGIIAVVGILGYNGFRIYQFLSPKKSSLPNAKIEEPSARSATKTPSPLHPSPSLIYVVTRQPSSKPSSQRTVSIERKGIENYFLGSEVDGFISISSLGRETVSEFNLDSKDSTSPLIFELSTYFQTTPKVFSGLFFKSTRMKAVLTSQKYCFLEFTFDKEAEAVLKEVKINTGDISNLLVISEKTVILGSHKAPQTENLLDNSPYSKGSGSCADIVGSKAKQDIFVSVSSKLFETPKHRLLNLYSEKLSSISLSWTMGSISSFSFYVDKSPDWISYIARDPQISIAPFIPNDSPLAFAFSIPAQGERALSTRLLWRLLFSEDRQEAERKAFTDNMALTPEKFAEFVRSRFYLYFTPNTEIAPENAVIGFNLPHSISALSLMTAIKPGDLFKGKSFSTMIFEARKIYFPQQEKDDERPQFSVAPLDNFVIASANNDSILESLKVYPKARGLLHRIDPNETTRITAGASAIIRLSTKKWPQLFDGIPTDTSGKAILAGFKFSRGYAKVDTNYAPEYYFHPFLNWLVQQRRK